MSQPKRRILVWVSWGAASVVAAREALRLFKDTYEVVLVNCDTRSSEHPDNYRFSEQVEAWLGQPVVYLKSEKFTDVDNVVAVTRYMSGPTGARCTTELKKLPRLQYASPDDLHVWGFTAEEWRRCKDFQKNNPDLDNLFLLPALGITKQQCLERIAAAGIELPMMYQLGFGNNNCPGCLKASSPWYWSMVREHFPEVFAKRCQQSRELGVRLIQCTDECRRRLAPGVVPVGEKRRIFLDELPPGRFNKGRGESLSCGPECGVRKES
jgi:hypothetical protein